GLTHYDEGSYALAGKWLATFGRTSHRFSPGFAPGLFPGLVGVFFALFGIHDYVAIAVSAVAGSMTAGLLYTIGTRRFGARVGIVAALFLATAEYHLVFSRLALTDATFTLLFWAGMACLFEAIESGDRRWFIAGGIVTGLCWNTKYNGFFPLPMAAIWAVL